jgi:Fe-S-cluster containining protein
MKELPKNTNTEEEISCQTCVAACCRAGSAILLSETEVSLHKRALGNPKPILRPKKYPQQLEQDIEGISDGKPTKVRTILDVPQNHGAYILLIDCTNIQPDQGYACANYDNRPSACQVYGMGSEACLAARAAFGLDGHPQRISPEIRTDPIKVKVPKYHTY